MTVVNPPAFMQAIADLHSAKLFRRATSGMLTPGIASFRTAGITTWPFGLSGDLAVSQRGAGANMSVDVTRGGCYVLGSDSSDQGEYFVYNDATLNVAIAASDPTNPRIDVIIARIKDAQEGGAAGDTSTIEVVQGTPSGSPVVPSLPASSLSLAQVLVGAAVSSIANANITDTRVMATDTLLSRQVPSVKVYRGSALNRNSGDFTAVPFDTEVWDTDAFHDNVTNNTRLTIPNGLGGKYLVQGQCMFGPSGAGTFRTLLIYRNSGASIADVAASPINSGTTGTDVLCSATLLLNAGDYVELGAWHDRGSALALGNSTESGLWFVATRLG